MNDELLQEEKDLSIRQEKIFDEILRERKFDRSKYRGWYDLKDARAIAERMTSADLDMAIKHIDLEVDNYIPEYVRAIKEEHAIRLERLLLGDRK